MSTKTKIILSVCILCAITAGIVAGVLATINQSFSINNTVNFTSTSVEATVNCSVDNNGNSTTNYDPMIFGNGYDKTQTMEIPTQNFVEANNGETSSYISFIIAVTNNSSDKNIRVNYVNHDEFINGSNINVERKYKIGDTYLADESMGIVRPGETYEVIVKLVCYDLYINTSVSFELNFHMTYTTEERKSVIVGEKYVLVSYVNEFYAGEDLKDYLDKFKYVEIEDYNANNFDRIATVDSLTIGDSIGTVFLRSGDYIVKITIVWWEYDGSTTIEQEEIFNLNVTVKELPVKKLNLTLRNDANGEKTTRFNKIEDILEISKCIFTDENYDEKGGLDISVTIDEGYSLLFFADNYVGVFRDNESISILSKGMTTRFTAFSSEIGYSYSMIYGFVCTNTDMGIIKEEIAKAKEGEDPEMAISNIVYCHDYYYNTKAIQKIYIYLKKPSHISDYTLYGFNFQDSTLGVINNVSGEDKVFDEGITNYEQTTGDIFTKVRNGVKVERVDINKPVSSYIYATIYYSDREKIPSIGYKEGIPTSLKIQQKDSSETIKIKFKDHDVKTTKSDNIYTIDFADLYEDTNITDGLVVGNNIFEMTISDSNGNVVEAIDLNVFIDLETLLKLNIDNHNSWGASNSSSDGSFEFGYGSNNNEVGIYHFGIQNMNGTFLITSSPNKNYLMSNVCPDDSSQPLFDINSNVEMSISNKLGEELSGFTSLKEGLNYYLLTFTSTSDAAYKITCKVTVIVESEATVQGTEAMHQFKNQFDFGGSFVGLKYSPNDEMESSGSSMYGPCIVANDFLKANLTSEELMQCVESPYEGGLFAGGISYTAGVEGTLWCSDETQMSYVYATIGDNSGQNRFPTFKKYLLYLPNDGLNSNAEAYVTNQISYFTLEEDNVKFVYNESDDTYVTDKRITVTKGMPIGFKAESAYADITHPSNVIKKYGSMYNLSCNENYDFYFEGESGDYDLLFQVTSSDGTVTKNYKVLISFINQLNDAVVIIANEGLSNEVVKTFPLNLQEMEFGDLQAKGGSLGSYTARLDREDFESVINNDSITLSIKSDFVKIAISEDEEYKNDLGTVTIPLHTNRVNGVSYSYFTMYVQIQGIKIDVYLMPSTDVLSPQVLLNIGGVSNSIFFDVFYEYITKEDYSMIQRGFMALENFKLNDILEGKEKAYRIYSTPTGKEYSEGFISPMLEFNFVLTLKENDYTSIITTDENGVEYLPVQLTSDCSYVGMDLYTKYTTTSYPGVTKGKFFATGSGLSDYEIQLPLRNDHWWHHKSTTLSVIVNFMGIDIKINMDIVFDI